MFTITHQHDEVTVLKSESQTIHLVGTAHVSEESAQLVAETINSVYPKVICVELDHKRLESLKNPHRWSETDLWSVIKSGRAGMLLVQLVLAGFQSNIAKKLGNKSGGEMLKAIELSEAQNIKLDCIDREIGLTMKRAWASLTFWELCKIGGSAVISCFSEDSVDADEIEKLKKNDALSVVMEELSSYLPSIKTSLVDERDSYMAAKLVQASQYETPIVAIVGAGHLTGMIKKLQAYSNTSIPPSEVIQELEVIPKSHWSMSLVGWIIPVVVLGMFGWGFFASGGEAVLHMAKSWVLITGTCAAVGTAVVLPHPLTILTAFIAAPLTTLHPMLAAGFFCGLVELFFRKPQVQDLENIGQNIMSVKGWWTNRVCRVLLVFFFSNLGSAIGAILGATILASSSGF